MRTGFRRPKSDRADETHQLRHLPRDFEKIDASSCTVDPADTDAAESGSDRTTGPRFEFTLHPGDLRPPLTEWLRQEDGVRVDYHTDLDEDPKGRYRLRAKDPATVERNGWTEEPIRLVMDKIEE